VVGVVAGVSVAAARDAEAARALTLASAGGDSGAGSLPTFETSGLGVATVVAGRGSPPRRVDHANTPAPATSARSKGSTQRGVTPTTAGNVSVPRRARASPRSLTRSPALA
jgi:hypothetical protein